MKNQWGSHHASLEEALLTDALGVRLNKITGENLYQEGFFRDLLVLDGFTETLYSRKLQLSKLVTELIEKKLQFAQVMVAFGKGHFKKNNRNKKYSNRYI